MGRRKTLDNKNLRRYSTVFLAVFIIVTFSGCLEEGDEESVIEDLGEPIDKTVGYVGKDGFGIPDVDEKLTGEGSLYALVKKETGAKAGDIEIEPYREVVITTYVGEDSEEVRTLTVDDQYLGMISEEQSEMLKPYLTPGEELLPLIKDLGGGRYDFSALVDSTKANGWEQFYGKYFEKTNANNAIFGDNKGKPEIFDGVFATKEEVYRTIIYNKAFFKEYGAIWYTGVKRTEEMQDINNLKGRTKDLSPELHIAIDDDIFIWIAPLDEEISYARIFSSPDKETGICIMDSSGA